MSRDSRVKVTSGKSLYGPNDFQINEDEPLISFFNHCLPREPLSAELPRRGNGCSADRLSIDCDSLGISFRRTVRKGGLFFAMYQREAMWLQFNSKKKFAIRIYVGGPMIPNMAYSAQAAKWRCEKKQDYIIVPEQPWVDGIATGPGIVKQFVAVPYGSGYSIESPGRRKTGGIQFEVIPAYDTSVHFKGADIYRTPHEIGLSLGSEMTMVNPKIPPSPTTAYSGMQNKVAILYKISNQRFKTRKEFRRTSNGSSLPKMSLKMTGSFRTTTFKRKGAGEMMPTMSFGAGGMIKQAINEDHNNPRIWDVERAKVFNVQVLNATHFEHVTKMMAPPTPVDVKVYAAAGFPFFDIFNEVPTDIHGYDAFKTIKSVSTLDSVMGAGTGVSYEPGVDVPLQKCKCQNNMLGCVIRPCHHAVCSECASYGSCTRCPVCKKSVTKVVGIAAPMGAPGMESVPKLPVVLLEMTQVDDGREKFVSIVRSGTK
ncbi:hypothetical protein DFJ58DRAFT_762246 [Suillus subalutaceus]|uniref:uncharacterized protein n=1 Tax=Suillus subalutaceus TaxID=48586 RepID=UPI001B8704CB|nr:uncharacterized protein DFJ58DRAFT_762246 [Suillus subalutaceus]KAG1871753.1 hypothetical protein DFJ58DRAFT_762246 [Suillus subalutaceus]